MGEIVAAGEVRAGPAADVPSGRAAAVELIRARRVPLAKPLRCRTRRVIATDAPPGVVAGASVASGKVSGSGGVRRIGFP